MLVANYFFLFYIVSLARKSANEFVQVSYYFTAN